MITSKFKKDNNKKTLPHRYWIHLMTFLDKRQHAKKMLSKNQHHLVSHNLIQAVCNPEMNIYEI